MTAEQLADLSLAVDGGDIAISVLGTGKPVLLLHGWTFDRRMWRAQYPLAQYWRLVMPDRRGFGQSPAPPCLEREYEDIERIMPEGPFAIIGFSQGATVAMDYARRHPERVSAMVLAGAPLHNVIGSDADGAVPLDAYRKLIATGNLAAMKQQWRRHRLMESEAGMDQDIDAMLADYTGRDLAGDDTEIELNANDIRNLSMPVMALTGEKDTPWRIAVTDYIGKNVPLGTSQILPDAGHLCPLAQPVAFNRLVEDFLDSTNC